MSTRKTTVSRRDVVITLDEDVLLKIKSRAEKQELTVHAWLENAVLDVYDRS